MPTHRTSAATLWLLVCALAGSIAPFATAADLGKSDWSSAAAAAANGSEISFARFRLASRNIPIPEVDFDLFQKVVECEGFILYSSPVQTTPVDEFGHSVVNLFAKVIAPPIFMTRTERAWSLRMPLQQTAEGASNSGARIHQALILVRAKMLDLPCNAPNGEEEHEEVVLTLPTPELPALAPSLYPQPR